MLELETVGRTLIPVSLAALLIAGCDRPDAAQPAATPSPPSAPTAAPTELPDFVGKIWLSTTFGKPRGSIKIFLPDKTLLMDSCFETYRIVEWGVISADTIRWREDEIPIEAQYTQPTPDTLHLKIAGLDDEQTYRLADAPYTCPDMPR